MLVGVMRSVPAVREYVLLSLFGLEYVSSDFETEKLRERRLDRVTPDKETVEERLTLSSALLDPSVSEELVVWDSEGVTVRDSEPVRVYVRDSESEKERDCDTGTDMDT